MTGSTTIWMTSESVGAGINREEVRIRSNHTYVSGQDFVIHNISQRTDYRGLEEVEDLGSHVGDTLGVRSGH